MNGGRGKSRVFVHYWPLDDGHRTKATVQYIGPEGVITGPSAIDVNPETAEWKARELFEEKLSEDLFGDLPPEQDT